jgi:hypothetical protein
MERLVATAQSVILIWGWVKTYEIAILGDKHPFSTAILGGVLTHKHMFMQRTYLRILRSQHFEPQCPLLYQILS